MKKNAYKILLGALSVILGLIYYNFETKDERKEISQSLSDLAMKIEDNNLQNLVAESVNEVCIGNGTEISTELLEVEVLKVVDGDTLLVDLNGEEKKVRLIGIDTPESVHSVESKNTQYGDLASEYTKSLLENTTYVYLQYDVSSTDTYGRDLAYVWLNSDVDINNQSDIDNFMLNAILVGNGYAYDKVYEPNSYYAEYFKLLREIAEINNVGLWQYEEFEKLW